MIYVNFRGFGTVTGTVSETKPRETGSSKTGICSIFIKLLCIKKYVGGIVFDSKETLTQVCFI